jgi:hypothetical protein
MIVLMWRRKACWHGKDFLKFFQEQGQEICCHHRPGAGVT